MSISPLPLAINGANYYTHDTHSCELSPKFIEYIFSLTSFTSGILRQHQIKKTAKYVQNSTGCDHIPCIPVSKHSMIRMHHVTKMAFRLLILNSLKVHQQDLMFTSEAFYLFIYFSSLFCFHFSFLSIKLSILTHILLSPVLRWALFLPHIVTIWIKFRIS